MKWIGQHIYDLVARFRNDVYLEDLSTTTETNVLVVDSDGKVSKTTVITGDVTGVTAGSNITVTDPTGPVPTVALSTNVDVAGTLDVTSLGTFDASVTVAGKISLKDAGDSIFVGYQAGLNDDASANLNVGVGYQALRANTTGANNTAHGYRALYSNTTGGTNTAAGRDSLYSNTTGSSNTALGYAALLVNTTGSYNSAFGTTALRSNTTGSNSVAVGREALYNNTASNQTAAGFQALYYNTIGGNNTGHGYRALHNTTTVVVALGTITGGSGYTDGTYTSVLMTHVSGSTAVTYPTATIVVAGGVVTTVTLTSFGVGFKDTTTVLSAAAASIGGTGSGFTVPVATISSGDNNTAIGFQALYANKQGDGNTATGTQAMYSNTTASNNTAIGLQALYSNTTGASNSAVGSSTLYSNTTGANNVAVGMSALQTNTTGTNNTATGVYALYPNTTGTSNSAVGYQALRSNTTGANNSAVGRDTLYSNTTGNNNTSVGIYSSGKNTTGTGNAALGYAALYENTTGSSNTAIGRDAGRFIADGTTANTSTSNSVFLGYNTKALATGQTNQIVIGDTAVGLGSNTAILGNSSITKTQLQGNVGIGTASPSRQLEVSNTGDAIIRIAGDSDNDVGETGDAVLEMTTDAGGHGWSIRSANILGGTGYFKVNTFISSVESTKLLIDRDGNVGIGTTSPKNKLDIVGSLGRGAPVTKTTDFTVAATENWLIMNGTATITMTLPTASSWTGRELMIKNIAAYTVISASSNVKPIDTDTAATAILPATAGSWCTLVSDGTNWVTMMN
jgi:hypothetical protein